MHIETISTQNDSVDSGSMKDLISYLAQIVLCKTDDLAKKKHKKLEMFKAEYKEINASVDIGKKRLAELNSEYARQKTINRILSLVDRLRQIGILNKDANKKLFKMLSTINSKDFESLRNLEEKLSSLLSEK